jgi:hypothetical protein
MKIYNYDEETKEYISTEEAQESPLEKGVYLIPANATELAPPKNKANEVSIFDEEKQEWNNFIDNRGKKVYSVVDAISSTVDYIGEIKEGFTLIEPTSIYDTNFVNGKWVANKQTKLKELKDVINNEIIKLDLIEYNGNTYQTDSQSILRMSDALFLAGSIFWRDAYNNKVLITNEDLKNIINIKAVSMQKLINKQFEIEEEVNNMTDKKVQKYKIDLGV